MTTAGGFMPHTAVLGIVTCVLAASAAVGKFSYIVALSCETPAISYRRNWSFGASPSARKKRKLKLSLSVRTLDIGGDKPVDYLDLQTEANPFLGWRAIRMAQENPDLLLSQFRALLRAAANGVDLRIMLPMVSSVEEVQHARQLFDQARAELKASGSTALATVQFGIMIEVPSAALIVEHLAEVVDFFSIGTNDLTQYTLAVDRTNERVAYLASPFHPAVIRLIARTIAHEKGRWVGLCGEMAGDPLAAPLLLGLGLDEFSMAAAAIPPLKQVIRSQNYTACQELAQQVLAQPTTTAVKNILAVFTNP